MYENLTNLITARGIRKHKYLLLYGTEYNMDKIFRVQSFLRSFFLRGEENKSRKSLNKENMSELYEEACDNS